MGNGNGIGMKKTEEGTSQTLVESKDESDGVEVKDAEVRGPVVSLVDQGGDRESTNTLPIIDDMVDQAVVPPTSGELIVNIIVWNRLFE